MCIIQVRIGFYHHSQYDFTSFRSVIKLYFLFYYHETEHKITPICILFRPTYLLTYWTYSLALRSSYSFSHFNYRSPSFPIDCRLSPSLNLLTPNDPSSGRTALLTSKRCILYIYSTNTGTEYFKHGIYSPFFTLQNAVCFIILTYLVTGIFTFYIQVC